MSYRYDISVIIVSYNCLEPLKKCLASVNSQGGASFEIIVVDNASSDGTPEFLQTQGFKKMLGSFNLGFGTAVNLANEKADGKYLLILNPDTVLPVNTMTSLLEFAESGVDIGLICPMLVYPDGEAQLSARNFPRFCDFLQGRGSLLHKLGLTKEKNAGYIMPADNEPFKIPAVAATSIFINNEFFRDLGGFDPRFFLYLEDIDLCRRIAAKGLNIWMLPALKVKHNWRMSSKTRPYFSSFHHHLSVYRYYAKYNENRIVRKFALASFLSLGFVLSSIITLFERKRAK